jgi:chromosome segregation ATPase
MSGLQTKMTTLQGFIADFDRSIASYEQQLKDLNAKMNGMMQNLQQLGSDIQALQQAQASMNTAANEADAAGQGGIAAALRAGAQALSDVITRLHNDETALFAKLNGLMQQAQTLGRLLQQFIAGRKQAQAVLDQLNQQYALAFGGYEGQCGG